MAPPFDFQTHRPVKGGDSGEFTENLYIALGHMDGTFYLRDGKIWGAGGETYDEDDVPDWVIDGIDALTLEARASVGFPPKAKLAAAKPAPAPAPKPAAPKVV